MRLISLLAFAASLFVSPQAARAELQWSGNVVTRYRIFNYNDSMSSVNNATDNKDVSKQRLRAWDFRGSVLAKATTEGGWEGVFGMRTWNVIVNDFVTANNAVDYTVRIDQAYGRKVCKIENAGEYTFTLGRQGTIILTDKLAQPLYDNDVRWDGFSVSAKHGMFGLVAGAFVEGAKSGGVAGASTYTENDATEHAATTQSGFTAHYAIQPNATFKVSDDIETTVGVGYYAWSNTNGYTNTIHGGYNSVTLNPAADTGTVAIDNARMWHLYNSWKLPYMLRGTIEFLRNKQGSYTVGGVGLDRDSLLLGLGYGGLKVAGDFAVDYYFQNKGLGSMPGSLTNGGVRPDNKGHMVYLRYMAVNNVTLGVVYYNLEEKSGKTSLGGASRVKQKQTQWYFTAGANF